jgi:hypothetical protein
VPTLPPITNAFALSPNNVAEATRIVELAARVSDVKDRHGGYLFLLTSGGSGYCSVVGSILDETKRDRYRAFAEEKARRLASHPDDKTSFESRDEAKERYQGAIKCPNGDCIGFSGRPAAEDEAICLMYAIAQALLTEDDAKEIAEISNNTFFWRMLDAS